MQPQMRRTSSTKPDQDLLPLHPLLRQPTVAGERTAEHERTFTLSLAEGSEIARLANCRRYSSLFAE